MTKKEYREIIVAIVDQALNSAKVGDDFLSVFTKLWVRYAEQSLELKIQKLESRIEKLEDHSYSTHE